MSAPGIEDGRMDALLRAAGDVRCVVVGDLMLDRYVMGAVERISPEAPVPVVRVEAERSAVGGAANVAHNVVALGGACAVVGVAGKDAGGAALRRELMALGIDMRGLIDDPARPTTVKTRVLARNQQVVRFDHEADGDVPAGIAAALADAVAELARDADVLVVEDYDKGVLVPAVVEAVLRAGRERGLPVVVDPKRQHFFAYPGATVFKPNAKELADALGERIRPEDSGWMDAVRRRLGCEHLLLTLGEHGMALQSPAEHRLIPAAAAARSVYDVSGAGDTVTAVLAVLLGAGATAAEAAVLANHAAALEVTKAGVATVTPDEIRSHFRRMESR